MSFPTITEMGNVIDYMSNLFVSDKVARGIYEPVPEPSNGPESPIGYHFDG